MYTDKNGMRHHNLDDKPWWWFNLEKAWKANKKIPNSMNRFDTLMHDKGIPVGIRYHRDQYIRWTLQQDYPTKRKPGRPKLPKSQLKQPKIKRSDEMKQLLRDNGIEIIDGKLSTHPDIKFLANGRLDVHGYPISVHQFLANIVDF